MQFASARSAAVIVDIQTTVKRWGLKLKFWSRPLDYVASLLNSDTAAQLVARLQQLQRGVGSGQVVAVPSYINPAGSPAAWDTLVASSPDKVGVVVANVLNGPGSQPVAAWTDVIDRAHSPGDEFPAIYQTVNQSEKTHHPGAMTVLNPGAVVPQCYEYAADTLLTFEGSYDTYEGSAYQPLGWTPADPMKIWHIIYGVPADKVSLVDETSQTRGAGYVYITDDVLVNPYDTIPSYLSAEQAAVPGGTPDIADAEPYDTGAAPPTAPSALTVTRR